MHGSATAQKSLLRFFMGGSVDDGKSTLIGRLLHETGAVAEDELAALTRDSARFGNSGQKLDFALLVDGLEDEREQGITIDVAHRYFSSPRRAFIVADTPGHEAIPAIPQAAHRMRTSRSFWSMPGADCCRRRGGTR